MYLYSRDFTCWKCERAYSQLGSSHSSWQHVSWWKAYVVTVGCVSSVFDHTFTSVLFFVDRKFTVLCDAFPSCLAICEDVKELSEKNHSTIAFYFGLKFRVVRGRVTATVDVFVERFRLKSYLWLPGLIIMPALLTIFKTLSSTHFMRIKKFINRVTLWWSNLKFFRRVNRKIYHFQLKEWVYKSKEGKG